MCRSADAMSMLPKSMDEDLEGGAKEAMKKMEGQKVTTASRGGAGGGASEGDSTALYVAVFFFC